MDITIKIEDISVTFDKPFIIKQLLDETLDNTVIDIYNSTQKLPYKMLDYVEILVDNTRFDFVILQDNVAIESKSPLKYTHTLQLVEPLKVLEFVTCDNLSFVDSAQSLGFGSQDAWTLKTVIDRFKKHFKLQTLVTDEIPDELFRVGTIVSNQLNTILAPQFFFTDLNCKELLVQVCAEISAYPKLIRDTTTSTTKWELQLDYFNEKGTQRNFTTDVDDFSLLAVGSDAIHSLKYLANNAIEDNNDDTIVEPSNDNWLLRRPKEGTDKVDGVTDIFETKYPIRKIFKVECIQRIANTDSDVILKEIILDLTRFIVDKGTYDILQKGETTEPGIPLVPQDTALINAGYYVIGEKNIQLFFDSGYDGILYKEIIRNAVQDYNVINREAYWAEHWLDASNTFIRIHYQPIRTAAFRVQKKDISSVDKETELNVNYQVNIPAISNLTTRMTSQVNKLGNAEITFLKDFTSITEIWDIGDYDEDNFIIVSRNLQLYPNHIECVFQATKDFQRVDAQVNLNTQLQLSEIASGKRTITRYLNDNEYLVITKEGFLPVGSNYLSSIKKILNTIDPSNPNDQDRPKICLLHPSGIGLDSNDAIYAGLNTFGSKNIMAFAFGLDDNKLAGFENIDSPKTGVQYTKDDGTIIDYVLKMTSSLPSIPTTIAGRREQSNKLPLTTGWGNVDTIIGQQLFTKSYVNLDELEILNFTYQINIIADQGEENDIIIGDNFAEQNHLVSADNRVLSIWTSNTETYNRFDTTFAKGTKTSISYSVNHLGGVNGNIILTSDMSVYSSWAIADTNSNLYLAVNTNGENIDRLRLGILKKREGLKSLITK